MMTTMPMTMSGAITGAFLADIFFSLIGSAAYLVPVLLAYRAVSLLLADDDRRPVDLQLLGFRSLGLLLLIVAATALRALNDAGDSGLPQGAGGILGAAIGAGFDQAFNPVGARLAPGRTRGPSSGPIIPVLG